MEKIAFVDQDMCIGLLESILKEEEEHIDLIEAQIDQISQMGIQNYLVEQID